MQFLNLFFGKNKIIKLTLIVSQTIYRRKRGKKLKKKRKKKKEETPCFQMEDCGCKICNFSSNFLFNQAQPLENHQTV